MKIFGKTIHSRLFLGSSRYPSPEVLRQSIEASRCDVLTVSLRRARIEQDEKQNFWREIKTFPGHLLPNTAGCRTAREAVTLAQMAREFFDTRWIKLEVTGDEETLQPDPFELVEAARILVNEGFEVFPYTTEDLVLAERLLSVGCQVLMPWASPIGSGRGLMNTYMLKTLRRRFPEVFMVIDAGIGKPSQAAQAMEMGFDAILLNTAVSQAHDPVAMAKAFALAVDAGRTGYQAGLMSEREMAVPSTPVIGAPFWHNQPEKALI